jgi:hypothetical protein
MENVRFDYDLVVEMEEMGIGVAEILQYAKAMLPHEQVIELLRGLEQIAASEEEEEAEEAEPII